MSTVEFALTALKRQLGFGIPAYEAAILKGNYRRASRLGQIIIEDESSWLQGMMSQRIGKYSGSALHKAVYKRLSKFGKMDTTIYSEMTDHLEKILSRPDNEMLVPAIQYLGCVAVYLCRLAMQLSPTEKLREEAWIGTSPLIRQLPIEMEKLIGKRVLDTVTVTKDGKKAIIEVGVLADIVTIHARLCRDECTCAMANLVVYA